MQRVRDRCQNTLEYFRRVQDRQLLDIAFPLISRLTQAVIEQ